MIAKCTFMFEGPQYGWTESIWQTNGYSDLGQVYPLAQQYALLRAPMLGTQCKIIGIRVSDEAEAGDALLNYVNIPGDSTHGADDPSSSLNVVMRDTNNKQFKHIFFRGIWDDVAINFGTFDQAVVAFQNAFNSWRAYMLSNSFGWMGVDKTARKTTSITGYTPTNDGLITFQLAEPLFVGLPAYRRVNVRISRLNGRSNLNGQIVLNVLTATTAQTLTPTAALPFRTPGFMLLNTKQFIDAVTCNTQRIGRRAPGAPLLASRGRSRVRPRG